MKENYIVCNCKQVSYIDILHALLGHDKMESVMELFEDVKNVTHCSTGFGGCYLKVLDIISEVMMG